MKELHILSPSALCLQVAAAALLERLLETTVDAEQLLDPNAGKPPDDKRKKYGQVGLSAGGSRQAYASRKVVAGGRDCNVALPGNNKLPEEERKTYGQVGVSAGGSRPAHA